LIFLVIRPQSGALSFAYRNTRLSLKAAGFSDLTETPRPRHPARGN
jgi:hypothetical protein